MSTKSASLDPEKQSHDVPDDDLVHTLNVLDAGAPAAVDPTSLWGRSLAWSAVLERKIGIEARGIQRVPSAAEVHAHTHGHGAPDSDPRPDRPHANLFIWLAANCVLSTFGIGILGPGLFFLGLGDSMLVVLFTNAATAVLPAYMATFGPKLGLRQMTSARYSWGWHGAKVVARVGWRPCSPAQAAFSDLWH